MCLDGIGLRWLCAKSHARPLLCAISVFSVSLWCVFARNSSTTETQRTQRLHREEGLHHFLCKAPLCYTIRANSPELNERYHSTMKTQLSRALATILIALFSLSPAWATCGGGGGGGTGGVGG